MGLSVALLLSLSFTLVAVAGCGDDGPVRGAGSIDVPKPAGFVMPEKGTARRGKTVSLPSRAN